MRDRIRTFAYFGPKLRGLIWFVYAAVWTTSLLTPQPAQILRRALHKEQAHYASKSLHVLASAAFAILTGWLRVLLRWRPWLLVFLSLHALSTEYLQHFVPERTPSWTDVGWDHVGIALGILLSWGWWTKAS